MTAHEAVLTTGVWRVLGASVMGTAHARAGLPCQDAHRWELLPNGGVIVAVADGAGSAPRSDVGAQCAADTAIAHLVAALRDAVPADEQAWHGAMAAAFDAAITALGALAEEATAPVREYATTLSLVAALPNVLAVGQIGDGIVVTRGADTSLALAAMPQRGEYANEVALLTAPDAMDHLAISVFPGASEAFAATTDGLLRLAVHLPTHEPHAPFFAPLFAFVAEVTDTEVAERDLAAFLASERVTRRTDDDKTLVLAVRVMPLEPATTDQVPDATPDG